MGWIVRARLKPNASVRWYDSGEPVVEPFRAVGGEWEDVEADDVACTPGYRAGKIRYVADDEAVVLASREDAVRFAAVLWAAHALDDMFGSRSELDFCEFQPGRDEPEFEYVEV